MAVKFFGQYLIEQGVITQAALLEAIKQQETTNRKIGEVILEMGLMTEGDIDRVHLAQRNEDIRFGDKAVAMGLISMEDLQRALTRQRNSHLYIGEALVKIGGLKEEDLAEYLKRFKQDQQPYQIERVEIPADIPNQPLWEMTADLTYKMLARVANMSFRPGACRKIESLPANSMIAEIGLSGDISARYLLSVTPSSRKTIARAILQEEEIDNESDEVLADTLMEFINIVCGNIAAKAAQIGFQLEIEPPRLHPKAAAGIKVPAGHNGLIFPIHLSDGETLALAVFIDNAAS